MYERQMQVANPLFEFARVDQSKVYSFEYILRGCYFALRWHHQTQLVIASGRVTHYINEPIMYQKKQRHLLIE